MESKHSGVASKKLQQSLSISNSSLVTEEPPIDCRISNRIDLISWPLNFLCAVDVL